jgi:hypothetical protein
VSKQETTDMQPERQPADLLARLKLLQAWKKPAGPTPADPMPRIYPNVSEAIAEIERLRRFVQFVADHSNDPGVVREARAHGAE